MDEKSLIYLVLAWLLTAALSALGRRLGHDLNELTLTTNGTQLATHAEALAHLAEPSPREPERWQPLARAYLRLGSEFDPTTA